MFKNILKLAGQHKVIAGIIVIAAIGGGYYGYKTFFVGAAPTRYVLAAVTRGTLISSVSASGQVSVLNQLEIKPKVSGDVVYVGVKNGQDVKAGALLVQLDSADAAKAVRNAQTSLETAKLELDELLEPVDELTLLQSENSLIQAKESKQSSESDLVKAYEDGFNSVVSAFFDLPGIMTDADNILHGLDISKTQENASAYADMVKSYADFQATLYKDTANQSYLTARAAYDINFKNFKAASRSSDNATVEALVGQTYDTAKKISEALKNADNLISFVNDTLVAHGLTAPKILATHQTTVRTDTSKLNSILSGLLGIKQSIVNDKDAIIKADRTIEEKTLSFEKTKAGADELTVRAKKIAVQQKDDALLDAQKTLSEYYIRAAFDGMIAKLNVKKGDSVSGSAVATLVTKQKLAEVTLNEVDIAKVKLGQKVTITFDAVGDLTLTGAVVDFDNVGTTSQGVVSYTVKINFDTQDERIKPGMSLSAAIITDAKQNVLSVPSSAIKQQGNTSYVEVVQDVSDPAAATQSSGITLSSPTSFAAVEVGISNDTSTEITSGLKEGEYVVARTASSAAAKTSTQSSGIRIPGMTGGGGGFGR